MIITAYSDLHTEFQSTPYIPPVIPEVDVIVLAGDCFVAGSDVDVEWLKAVINSQEGKHVIFVPGNHEYYGASMDELHGALEELEGEYKKFHFLNNKSVEIDGVMFHGSTLWTDFEGLGPDMEWFAKHGVEKRISDFRMISTDGNSRLRATDVVAMAKESQKFLTNALLANKGKTNVVVTHFSPLIECDNGRFTHNNLTPYFNNNLIDVVEEMDCDLWIYGHVHYNRDIVIHDTRFYSNQRCYPSEINVDVGIPFNPEYFLEI